ncbi:MAG: MMPL family transporter [Verrucomicrobium sp.]|nr:MMPL family transporter [Verrucomicrobium sp.]
MIHRLLQSFLVGLARFIHRWPRLIAFTGVVLTAAAIWLTVTKLTVSANTDNLVSAKSPANRYYLDYVKEFNVTEDFVVVIRSNDVAKNRQAAQFIGSRLEAMQPDLRRVLYHIDFSKLQDHFLLFLDAKDLEGIRQEVGGYAAQLRQNNVRLDLNSMLDQADAMFNDKYLRKKSNWKEFKPFVDRFADMLDQLADQIENKADAPKAKGAKVKPGAAAAQGKLADISKEVEENEYPGFDEGRTLVITASPAEGKKEGRPYEVVIPKIRAVLAEARQAYPDVDIGLTGEPVLTDDEVAMSAKDSAEAGALAFALIAVLFFVSYRERTRPVIALLVLLMAVSWSLGLTVLTVGHLNIISQAFVAMVIGLGIDFGIQIMGRYEEELARGSALENALVAGVGYTGAAVVTGGTTTALAFFTMCFNDFTGLAEFGVVAGSGVVLCLVANLVLLPAVYVLMDRRKSPQVLRSRAAASSLPGQRIDAVLFGHPRLVLGAAAAATVAAAFFIPKVRFDYNLLNLQSPKLESVREALVLNAPGNSILFGVSVADNVEDARARIARFQALPTVAAVRCPIVDMTPRDLDSKRPIVREIAASLEGVRLNTDVSDTVDVARARVKIGELLNDCQQGVAQARKYRLIPQAREAVEVFGKLIPPLERAQKAMEGLSQAELGRRLNRYQVNVFGTMRRNLAFLAGQKAEGAITVEDIPLPLRERYLSPHGKILIEISPKENVWNREADAAFVRDLRTVDPRVTGAPVQNFEYIDLLRASYVQAAKWAAVAIVILICLHFGRPSLILLTLLPLAMGIAWTLGLMGAFHYPFNPANIVTLPLVIGIGVAYGVYTVDRYREDQRLSLFHGSTGKAIVLSALTAMIGFGSMMISAYPGLFSLGLLMFLGVGMCLVTSIGVMPQLLKLRQEDAPSAPVREAVPLKK